MVDLYKNIRSRRKELKMSQEELAKRVGYTNRSTIATIESGKMDIPLSKVKEIAAALECSPVVLLGWDVDVDYEKGAHDGLLLVKYNKLCSKFQEAIDAQIDLFLEIQKNP